MGMMSKLLTAVAMTAAVSAGAVQAGTLGLDPSGSTQVTLAGNFNPAQPITGLPSGTIVTNFSGLYTGGLTVAGPVKVTLTYLSKEASFANSAQGLVAGAAILTDTVVGASTSFVQSTAGLLKFKFMTAGLGGQQIDNGVGSANSALDMAFKKISDTSYYALFGDGGGGNDDDFDDMVLRIDVAPVPLPAAGFLLFGAIGGLAALRRRKAT
jgi:hypothetical protein